MRGDRPIYFMLKPEQDLTQKIGDFRNAQRISADYPIDRLRSTVQPLWDRRALAAGGLQRLSAFMTLFRGEPFIVAFNRFNGNALPCGLASFASLSTIWTQLCA